MEDTPSPISPATILATPRAWNIARSPIFLGISSQASRARLVTSFSILKSFSSRLCLPRVSSSRYFTRTLLSFLIFISVAILCQTLKQKYYSFFSIFGM